MGCNFSVLLVAEERGNPNTVTDDPDSRVLKGQAYVMQGKLDEAIKELNYVIKTWPNYARAYLERGNVRYQLQDWDACAQDCTSAIKHQADFTAAYVMRAQIYYKMGKYDEAIADCRMAGSLDPGNGQIRVLRRNIAAAYMSINPNMSFHSTRSDESDPFSGHDSPAEQPRAKLCMICMDNERGCRLRPCFHAALCSECAELMRSRGHGCPICGARIEQVEIGKFMKTFSIEDSSGTLAILGYASGGGVANRTTVTRSRFAPTEPTVDEHDDEVGEHEGEGERTSRTSVRAARPSQAGMRPSPHSPHRWPQRVSPPSSISPALLHSSYSQRMSTNSPGGLHNSFNSRPLEATAPAGSFRNPEVQQLGATHPPRSAQHTSDPSSQSSGPLGPFPPHVAYRTNTSSLSTRQTSPNPSSERSSESDRAPTNGVNGAV